MRRVVVIALAVAALALPAEAKKKASDKPVVQGSTGKKLDEALYEQDQIDQELHGELTKLEEIISEQLIESTLNGEDTDFVTQHHVSPLEMRRLFHIYGRECLEIK